MLTKPDRLKYFISLYTTMTVDIIVQDPKRIDSLEKAIDILSKILAYEEETGNPAGVLSIQNPQTGLVCLITSQEEAERETSKPVLSNPRTPEWGVRFYPRSYFEELRERFSGQGEYL